MIETLPPSMPQPASAAPARPRIRAAPCMVCESLVIPGFLPVWRTADFFRPAGCRVVARNPCACVHTIATLRAVCPVGKKILQGDVPLPSYNKPLADSTALGLSSMHTFAPPMPKEVAMAEVQLRNISKRWGNFVGVANFDLTIADREFLVLLGPSGCGKTTTMRMIAGLEDATEGDILVDGKRVNDLDPKDRDVAMVFQSYALYPESRCLREHPLPAEGPPDRHGQPRRPGPSRRRDGRTHRIPAPPPRRSVGRPAAARGACPRHRPPAQRVPDGRAPVEPRRETPRLDPRADQEPQPRTQGHHDLRHP